MLIGVRRKEKRNLNFHLAQQDRAEKWYNREICDTVTDGRKNKLSEEGGGEKERWRRTIHFWRSGFTSKPSSLSA